MHILSANILEMLKVGKHITFVIKQEAMCDLFIGKVKIKVMHVSTGGGRYSSDLLKCFPKIKN